MISLLYIATGAVGLVQTFRLLMWAIWGAPISALEYVALLGSLCLFIFGFVHIWSKPFAGRVIAVSLLLIWSYYLPATIFSLHMIFDTETMVDLSIRAWWRPLLLLCLLLASSCFAVRGLNAPRRSRQRV